MEEMERGLCPTMGQYRLEKKKYMDEIDRRFVHVCDYAKRMFIGRSHTIQL